MVPADPAPGVPLEVYLERERSAETKHELWAGDVFAMPGASLAHNKIVADLLMNPTLVVEVLSDSTEGFDRGEKLAGYRSIESVRQVVLVAQHERRVEVYTRETAVRWILEDTTAGVVRFEAIDCVVPLDEIYLKVFDRPGAD